MNLDILKSKIDLSFILISIIFYLIVMYLFRVDIIGYWESVSVYSSLEPGSSAILGNIQIAADTTGGHGIGYPLILLSQYFAKIFTLSFSSLKYIFLIYSILFLIFYYYSIKYIANSFIAFFSLIFLIINPYFLYMNTMLISQTFTLALVFLNILLFIKFEKNKSLILFFILSISISLLLMNYILGRYILLITILYFFFRAITQKSFSKEIIVQNIFLYSKLILLSLFILIVIFPPNLDVLFSKNLFLPVSALQQGGETILYENRILEIIFLNIKHIINTYFLSPISNNDFNIINSEPANLFPLVSIFFFLFGFFTAFKKKVLILFKLIFLNLVILIVLSNSVVEEGNLVSTSISVYRMYMLVPIMTIFISYGVQEISNYFFKNLKYNQIFKLSIMIILIIFNFQNIIKSDNYYNQIRNNYFTENNKMKKFLDKQDKNYEYRLALDYHVKIRSLSNKLTNFIENKKNNTRYIYLNIDADLDFLKYPPRLKNDNITKYSKHIFYTLYLNDISDENYTFIYHTKDELSFKKKIINYSNMKDEDIKGSTDKIIAKKIAKLFKKIITIDYKIDTYKIYKVNYFNNIENIILFNEEEYLYVKDVLGLDVHSIRTSEL